MGGIFEPKVAADLVLLLSELCECCHVFLRLWVGVVVVGGAECWRWVAWWASPGWGLCLLSVGCATVEMGGGGWCLVSE